MANKNRLNQPVKNKGPRLSAPEGEGVNYDNKPPVFSLERIQNGDFCFSKLSTDDKASFGDAIFKRRSLSWREIKQDARHALGFEKIEKNKIKAGMPRFITDEHRHFLAFRFNGKKPMVGYRLKDVFYVLWFDASFNLYDH